MIFPLANVLVIQQALDSAGRRRSLLVLTQGEGEEKKKKEKKERKRMKKDEKGKERKKQREEGKEWKLRKGFQKVMEILGMVQGVQGVHGAKDPRRLRWMVNDPQLGMVPCQRIHKPIHLDNPIHSPHYPVAWHPISNPVWRNHFFRFFSLSHGVRSIFLVRIPLGLSSGSGLVGVKADFNLLGWGSLHGFRGFQVGNWRIHTKEIQPVYFDFWPAISWWL